MTSVRDGDGQWRAILQTLRFHESDPVPLQSIPEHCWPTLLDLADRTHLTLALAVRCRTLLPATAGARVERNLARNADRYSRLIETSCEISAALGAVGVEFVFLMGLTHRPHFIDQSEQRPQYDIDLYCPGASLIVAQGAIDKLGFEQLLNRRDDLVDHLPTMIRRTGWRWRGDYFDPKRPFSIELHFRLWNPEAEFLAIEGLDDLWRRRTARNIGPCDIPALRLPDTVSFAALHLFRHLLRGGLRPHHAYELAHFLERPPPTAPFGASGKTPFPLLSKGSRPYRFGLPWNGSVVGPIPLFCLS